MAVRDNKFAWVISSGVEPDDSAFLIEGITEILELAPMAMPILMMSDIFVPKGRSPRMLFHVADNLASFQKMNLKIYHIFF